MKFTLTAAAVLMGSVLATADAQTTKPAPVKGTQDFVSQSTNGTAVRLNADDCAAPAAIAGTGTFAFDNSLATTGTQGQNEPLCYAFGSSAVDFDVWFDWTASATGSAGMTTVGGTTVDTKIAAYAGAGCPTGAALACNDDSTGLQSTISFSCTSGSVYSLQVGTFPGASGGTGTFDMSIIPAGTPTGADDCLIPDAIAGQGVFPFNNASATTGTQGQNETLCYAFGSSAVNNDVWFAWTADASGVAVIDTCGLTGVDTKIAAYDGSTCPTAGALACNDDTCGLQSSINFMVTSGTTYTLQVGTFPGASGGTGTFNVSIGAPLGGCSYDSGVTDNAIGLTAGGGMAYYQAFDASCATSVQSVEVAYGSLMWAPSVANGSPATICIWDDPNDDYNGDDCVLLASLSTTVVNADTDILNAYAFPTVGVSGVYFVGAVVEHLPGEFPAAIDQQSPSQARAWLCGNTTPGAFDINTLTNNDVPPQSAESVGFGGSWLVRTGGAVAPGVPTCLGESPAPCQCGNNSAMGSGEGCVNSTGVGGLMWTAGTDIVANHDLVLHVSQSRPNKFGMFVQGVNFITVPFKDGILCMGNPTERLGQVLLDMTGSATSMGIDIATEGNVSAGDTRYYQFWFRDGNGLSVCGENSNLTNGYTIMWQ